LIPETIWFVEDDSSVRALMFTITVAESVAATKLATAARAIEAKAKNLIVKIVGGWGRLKAWEVVRGVGLSEWVQNYTENVEGFILAFARPELTIAIKLVQ
jgi:hypothetical protein